MVTWTRADLEDLQKSTVHIVGPDVLWRFTVEHREDSSAQVGLAGSLSRAGDGNDELTGQRRKAVFVSVLFSC